MSTIFEKNLKAIARRYPHYLSNLTEALKPAPPEPHELKMVRDWLSRTLSQQGEQYILLGIGKGYALHILLREFKPLNLVIIEQDFGKLSAALSLFDFSSDLENPHNLWLVEIPPKEIKTKLKYMKTALAARGFRLLQNPLANSGSDYYTQVNQELKSTIEHETFNLKARLMRGKLAQSNLIGNIHAILESYTPDDIFNLFSGQPAVVAAAGPSLDKNVIHLSKAQNRAVLLCVDTALRTLKIHEIEPDIVVTTDPTLQNAKHFDGIHIKEHTCFAFSPDVHSDIPLRNQYLPLGVCLHDNSTRLSYYLRELLGFQRLLERPPHVGETAIRLALLLGCDPIILVGLDLASAEGTTHTEAGSYSSQIVNMTDNQVELKTKEGTHISQAIVKVPGVDGCEIPTLYSFYMYLENLNELIASTTVRWIDATEGGALKKGCEILPLEEALNQIGHTNINVNQQFRGLPEIDKDQRTSIKVKLRQSLSHINAIADKLKAISTGAANEPEAVEAWNQFLEDPVTRALLDHAVFPFQLHPPVEQIPPEKRLSFLQKQAGEAHAIIHTYVRLWEKSLKNG